MSETELSQILVPGRFSQAIDCFPSAINIPWQSIYGESPCTVEMWVKSNTVVCDVFLARYESPESAYGFMIMLGAFGKLVIKLPHRKEMWVNTKSNLFDHQWHHIGVVFEPTLVRCFVDGRECGHQENVIRVPGAPRRAGPLILGTQEDTKFPGYNAIEIEELRITKGIRAINAFSLKPMECDAATIGFWRADTLRPDGTLPDLSATANHATVTVLPNISQDESDRRSFKAGPTPFEIPAREITLQPGRAEHPNSPACIFLDGTWEMAENGGPLERVAKLWPDAIPAQVPGSVHSALEAAGKIPDPKMGRQDALANEKSFQTWWFKREFARPLDTFDETLHFAGVGVQCTVWLNGNLLGQHEGMFGGPEYKVGTHLKDQNTLLVRVDPAPFSSAFIIADNNGWRKTVTINNVYGWHYSNIPSLGIWRSVTLQGAAEVKIKPIIAARNLTTGQVSLRVDFTCPYESWQGQLVGTIEPDNFAGKPVHFSVPADSTTCATGLHLSFCIPDPHLWWPNDLGAPDLYRLKLSFIPTEGTPDTVETTFGLRTIEMAPLPVKIRSKLYNWTFIINGQKHFVKGNGWCTLDSSLDFSRARYERFLTLADQQHVQLMRAWGCGLPETDDYYDLCDRLGIMVIQEWPTAWGSDREQPFDVLEETVRLNTLRLRNHPSLIMYGGGNETRDPFSSAIDMMGRYATELDGTRPFHRGEPWGGSDHNYDCWWAKAPLDFNLNMTAYFYGEFGIASLPVYESVQRYLPDQEKHVWPAPEGGSLQYHTPIFNHLEDYARAIQYSGYFSAGETLQRFIQGSQLAQAVALRHPLERARTRWPNCTGSLYYKMNDNYPAVSWSTADWYGAPKIAHYFCQDAFAPLHAAVLFESVNNQRKALQLPVFLLDDGEELKGSTWQVRVRAFDGKLALITQQKWEAQDSVGTVHRLGEFCLTEQQTNTTPLFVVTEVIKNGILVDRSFYFVNYEAIKDSLFELPRTTVQFSAQGNQVTVTNTGKLPAVGTAVLRPNHLDTFTISDNYFWLDAGESRTLEVNTTEGLIVEAWNSESRSW